MVRIHVCWQADSRIQQSTSKTLAKQAEQKRRRELEQGFNSIEDVKEQLIRSLREVSQEYLESYSLRHRSTTFAEHAVKHLVRRLGDKMIVDINEKTVREYQDERLREKAAPKTINEEVGILLRLIGERGALIRETVEAEGPEARGKGFQFRREKTSAGGGTGGQVSDDLSCVDVGHKHRHEK